MIPIPKRQRVGVTRSDSAAEVLATVKAKAATAQATRVAAADRKAPHLVAKLELQAMLDKATKTYLGGAVRVMVTNKEFGLLRKRLRENPPRDLAAFVDWLIRSWGNISTQHAKAIQRNESRLTKGEKAIPASPDFASLAYRYPYFLKAHANFLAERTTAAETAETDKRVDRLKAQLAQKDADIQVLRRTRRPPAPAPAAPRTRPVAPRGVAYVEDLGDDIDLPPWETQNTFGRKRNVG